jgi:hypothetical protein
LRSARCAPGSGWSRAAEPFDLGSIASFRSPANQAAQVSLVSGDVDAAYVLAQATGLLLDYDKCQACIADVHSAFRSGS